MVVMTRKRCRGLQWKDLPDDIVCHIGELLSLSCPVDYINFGRVCRSWKGALLSRRSLSLGKSLQAPTWLMVRDNDDLQRIMFLNIFSGEMYTTVAKHTGHQLGARGGSWLVTLSPNLKDTLVWNPMLMLKDQALHRFPSILKLPGFPFPSFKNKNKGIIRCEHDNFSHPSDINSAIKIKPFKSSSPDNTTMVVASIYYHDSKIAYARADDSWWTPVSVDINNPNHHVIHDVVVHQGYMYAVDRAGRVYSWDISCRPANLLYKSSLFQPTIYNTWYNLYFATSCTKLVIISSTAVGQCDMFELEGDTQVWSSISSLGGGSICVENNRHTAVILDQPHFQHQHQIFPASNFGGMIKAVQSYKLVGQNEKVHCHYLSYVKNKMKRRKKNITNLGWFIPKLSP